MRTTARFLMCAAIVLAILCVSRPLARADETTDYVNQIYQDQAALNSYLNQLQETQNYVNQIYQDQKQLDDYLKSISQNQ
jgi:Tfp pilus assembly protein PilP